MPAKMHPAVVEQFGKPLEVVEWDVPTPGAGQILVKTEACDRGSVVSNYFGFFTIGTVTRIRC